MSLNDRVIRELGLLHWRAILAEEAAEQAQEKLADSEDWYYLAGYDASQAPRNGNGYEVEGIAKEGDSVAAAVLSDHGALIATYSGSGATAGQAHAYALIASLPA